MTAWKLIPTVLLAGGLIASLTVAPPRTPIAPRDMVRLVVAVSTLYLAGGAALLAHRTGLAALVFGAGLALCAVSVWLARGGTPPPRGDGGSHPPSEPTPPVEPAPIVFDWSYYEDQLRASAPDAPEPQPHEQA